MLAYSGAKIGVGSYRACLVNAVRVLIIDDAIFGTFADLEILYKYADMSGDLHLSYLDHRMPAIK